jgi:hypothetical protein
MVERQASLPLSMRYGDDFILIQIKHRQTTAT